MYPGTWWGSWEDGGEILHQTISEEWASLNREVADEAGGNEIFFWMRAGTPVSIILS